LAKSVKGTTLPRLLPALLCGKLAALFGAMPNPTHLQAPHVGEHGRELLRQLGRSDVEIDALLASRAGR
jgi:hypothetical protein